MFTIRPDGTGLRRLTNSPGNDAHSNWSDDGEWVVFSSGRKGFKDEMALYDGVPQPYGEIFAMRSDGSEPKRIIAGSMQLPDLSPDGEHVLYVNGLSSRIVVARVRDGAPAPFEIEIKRRSNTTTALGRARWMPDGRAIAFVGQDENGVNGVFVQDFLPGHDTSDTRRRLGGFDPDNSTESFAI